MKRLLPVAILLLNVIPLCAQQRLDAYGDPLPDGALVRMGSQRFRPPQNRFGAGDICVAVMPDGKTFATGEERGVRFWDISPNEENSENGKRLRGKFWPCAGHPTASSLPSLAKPRS